ERAEVAGDRGQRLVRALVDEVVPADHGADDAAGLAEQRLERAPGADGALARGHALVGALLAPDAGEELIDVVGHAERGRHARLLIGSRGGAIVRSTAGFAVSCYPMSDATSEQRGSPSGDDPEIESKVAAVLDGLGVPYEVVRIDPAFADTAAFCE